jgi:hypothetical protein
MSFFYQIQVTLLNFAQRVVTITTGADIGINNILQQINANFTDIQRMFDPKIAGGGLKGENMQEATVTNRETNLDFQQFENPAFIAVNKNGNAERSVVLNGSITTLIPNKKVIFLVENAYEKSTDVNLDGNIYGLGVDVDTTSAFNSPNKQFKGTMYGLGIIPESAYAFHRRPLTTNVMFTFAKAGTYYFRVAVSHDGPKNGNINSIGTRVITFQN